MWFAGLELDMDRRDLLRSAIRPSDISTVSMHPCIGDLSFLRTFKDRIVMDRIGSEAPLPAV